MLKSKEALLRRKVKNGRKWKKVEEMEENGRTWMKVDKMEESGLNG